jgi:hypothetical protein
MLPPSTILDCVLSGTALTAAMLWYHRTRGSPPRRIRTLVTVVALFGAVALLSYTLFRFGYVDAVLSPSSGFSYGPFWRALPAIAAETLTIVLFSISLVRGVLRPAKQTW